MATSKSGVTVTQRKNRNEVTGMDMNVPSYVPADSARNVRYFHVVVISRLPYFKNEEHSEEDTVHFMVQRDYEAFEKLQKDLILQYPNLKLPMPRKHFLFMSEEDLEDRRVSFDCLLTVLAKNKELCTSIPVLIFLGVDLLADRKYAKRRKEYLKRKKEKQAEDASTAGEEIDELFSSKNSKNGLPVEDEFEEDLFKDPPKGLNKSIEETSEKLASVKVSLLSDEDIGYHDALLVSQQGQEPTNADSIFNYEEDEELTRITDSLDDVPIVPIAKKKNTTPTSSQSTKKKIKDSLFDDDDGTSNEAATMGTNDVMDYIKQNQSSTSADDDLSLF